MNVVYTPNAQYQQTELLDSFAEQPTQEIIVDSPAEHSDDIGIGKADFSWTNEPTDGTVTPSRQTFRLRIDDELIFKKGKFNLIIGPTGSGKTSVLMALLREMHYIPLGPQSWTNLPRDGGVAYAAQESWVQNETIKVRIIWRNEAKRCSEREIRITSCSVRRLTKKGTKKSSSSVD